LWRADHDEAIMKVPRLARWRGRLLTYFAPRAAKKLRKT
jgi:hypothetical protein